MVHHNDKIFEGMETYGIDREVVWSYEFMGESKLLVDVSIYKFL